MYSGVFEAVARLRMDFLNDLRSCVFKKDMNRFQVGGRTFGPYKAGAQAEFPNWILDVLLKHDVVELAPEDAFDSLPRIRNLYNTERGQPLELHDSLPSRFLYVALTQKIRRLKHDSASLDPRTYDEIEKIQQVASFLRDTRLSKILRVAKAGISQDMIRRMTMEEKWLCEELSSLLSRWRSAVLDEHGLPNDGP